MTLVIDLQGPLYGHAVIQMYDVLSVGESILKHMYANT